MKVVEGCGEVGENFSCGILKTLEPIEASAGNLTGVHCSSPSMSL